MSGLQISAIAELLPDDDDNGGGDELPARPDAQHASGKSKTRTRRKRSELAREWQCNLEMCSRAYASQSALRAHIRSRHLADWEGAVDWDNVSNAYCLIVRRWAANLREHRAAQANQLDQYRFPAGQPSASIKSGGFAAPPRPATPSPVCSPATQPQPLASEEQNPPNKPLVETWHIFDDERQESTPPARSSRLVPLLHLQVCSFGVATRAPGSTVNAAFDAQFSSIYWQLLSCDAAGRTSNTIVQLPWASVDVVYFDRTGPDSLRMSLSISKPPLLFQHQPPPAAAKSKPASWQRVADFSAGCLTVARLHMIYFLDSHLDAVSAFFEQCDQLRPAVQRGHMLRKARLKEVFLAWHPPGARCPCSAPAPPAPDHCPATADDRLPAFDFAAAVTDLDRAHYVAASEPDPPFVADDMLAEQSLSAKRPRLQSIEFDALFGDELTSDASFDAFSTDMQELFASQLDIDSLFPSLS